MFSWLKAKKKTKLSNDELMMKQWVTLQKKGKRKYVWIDGVVRFGIGIPTFVVLVDLLIGDNVYSSKRELFVDYFKTIIFFSIAAYFYKRSGWKVFENWSLKKDSLESLDSKIDFCYYCGSEIENQSICPNCGKNLET